MPMNDEERIEQPSSANPGQQDPALTTNSVSADRVWEALRQCYDPEIPVNIVDLGLVYEMKVDEELPGEANVFVKMTLTAPGCGMGPMIAGDVKRRIQQIPGVRNVLVEVVFDPIWSTSMMSEAAKLMLNIG
jgi:probable FeS assembly SUF system protein SufT